jgi:hypothetical protein
MPMAFQCVPLGFVSGLFAIKSENTYKAHISSGVRVLQSYKRTQRSTSRTKSDNVYSKSSLLILPAF